MIASRGDHVVFSATAESHLLACVDPVDAAAVVCKCQGYVPSS